MTEPSRHLGLTELRPAPAIWLDRALGIMDRWFTRVYGSQWNPLYKSGTLAILFILATLVTGIYLFIFYRVAEPYASVAEIDATWLGSLMRSIHRYAADLTIVAVAVHAFKMLAAGRTWGPRALAWITGLLLLGATLLCGWTGLVMAWDVQGQLVALEGARLLDLLPVLSEPMSRSFTQPEAVGRAFFFMNLFLHVALPLGLAGLFWLHSSRVARGSFLPPRPVLRYALVALVLVSLLVPVPLPPEADLLAKPIGVPLDVFYAFWLPVARAVSPATHLMLWLAAIGIAFSIPWWWKPGKSALEASYVEESQCVGCGQCYYDCPYEAISMIPRDPPSTLSETVARVDESLCVSCGICTGSCAPMSVGPPGRTGREQLKEAKAFLSQNELTGSEVVLVGCQHGIGSHSAVVSLDGVMAYSSGCSGSVHTSAIELFVRSGAAGVFLLTCPDRDCLYREGPQWLHERIYNDREAELQPRVDKRRIRVRGFAVNELDAARQAIGDFQQSLAELGGSVREHDVDLSFECDPQDVPM